MYRAENGNQDMDMNDTARGAATVTFCGVMELDTIMGVWAMEGSWSVWSSS